VAKTFPDSNESFPSRRDRAWIGRAKGPAGTRSGKTHVAAITLSVELQPTVEQVLCVPVSVPSRMHRRIVSGVLGV